MDTLRFRDRPSVLMWLYAAFISSVVTLGVVELIVGLDTGTESRIVVGVVFVAVAAPFGWIIATSLRPRVLTSTELLVPTAFGHRSIELSEVAAVALLRIFGKRTAWYLRLWTVDGRQHGVGIASPTKIGKGWREELSNEYLEASVAGRPAVAIWQRARALQGSDGPLDRTPIESRLRFAPTTVAYWTPGGLPTELQRPGTRLSR